jgi:hypothetical protein
MSRLRILELAPKYLSKNIGKKLCASAALKVSQDDNVQPEGGVTDNSSKT